MTEIDVVVARAREAARVAARSTAIERSAWLSAVADALAASESELVALADEETHLGEQRLVGELARTTAQLRAMGAAVVEGSYLEATIDHPSPTSTPPVPDLRRMLIPLGVVAVYSASNFPFAFSVFGGDTAAALAVGSSVVVKAHPGHERLSRRVAELGAAALAEAGAPGALFALVEGFENGLALVRHDGVDAAAFTGSVRGGRALFDEASARPRPIPFYGELGSINPVVITDGALKARREELAGGLAASFTLGHGQFCTKPGLVFVPDAEAFGTLVADAIPSGAGEGPLLTESIHEGYVAGLSALESHSDVTVMRTGVNDEDDVAPTILRTTARALTAEPALREECFGPTTLLVSYEDHSDLIEALASLDGSLTATLHAEGGEDVAEVLDSLTAMAGRVLYGGWPTGVAVSWAQTHGGPYPSTTSIFTSVGQTSLRRFMRPVSYQTMPAELLPTELRDDNPLSIPQRVDGELRLP